MRLIAGLALALLGALPALAQSGSPATLEVKQVWARATPAGAKTGAIYLTVVNGTASDDKLLSASTPAAHDAMLHTMIDDNGVMKMRELQSVAIKAGSTVTLRPGGVHVMLMGLAQPLKPGDSFPLTLQFEKGGKKELTVTVTKAGAMGMDGMGDMGSAPDVGNMPGMGNMPGHDMGSMGGHGTPGKPN
ncbi:MAG TPA: copper chaperone PCu(A)C [Stellaceae bacterium]|nr:copper chaperone PCu(A)C [Stellaceae bacterium]